MTDPDVTGLRPGARIREVDLTGARLRGVILAGAQIDGDIRGLVVNGVDVEPLLRAELDRRHPERVLMRSGDPASLWDAATRLHELWDQTLDRIRALSPALRSVRVDDEWSALETLRHLVYIHDAWFSRGILGATRPFHPMGIASSAKTDPAAVGLVGGEYPLEQIEPVWTDQYIELLGFLDDASADDLDASDDGLAPGDAIRHILAEQWEHRRFCERDLDQLPRDQA